MVLFKKPESCETMTRISVRTLAYEVSAYNLLEVQCVRLVR